MDLYHLKTPLGVARIMGNMEGISEISILNEIVEESGEVPKSLSDCINELKEYFQGNRKEFGFIMNPQGTEFQKRVWTQLLSIPYGKTKSYLELTKELGDEKAIRAVASANGKNPIWIAIPCHRVIGSDGSLTGYAGGLHRKKWLLEHEGALKQMSLFKY